MNGVTVTIVEDGYGRDVVTANVTSSNLREVYLRCANRQRLREAAARVGIPVEGGAPSPLLKSRRGR